MDLSLARTFLAICETGNFVKAAAQLYITQSTVSARVKQLEDELGQKLFVRTKAGASLTSAGAHFRPYAEKLVLTWEQARHDVGLPEDFAKMLVLGVEHTLWEHLLVRWISWIRNAIPDLAIRAEIGTSGLLMRQLLDGLAELVVTYSPQMAGSQKVEKLMEERLVLVSTARATRGPWEDGYVFVDWGPEFRLEHAEAFPARDAAVVSVSYGPLALQYILANGGSAYLPLRVAHPLIEDGRLHRVRRTPVFRRAIYAVYFEDEDDERFRTALQGLKYVASLETGS